MKNYNQTMRPQDIIILLKVMLQEDEHWTQMSLAKSLYMSQSEISESLARSRYARLLYEKGKKVNRSALMKLLENGVPYTFPQQPGQLQQGFPTAHSAAPLNRLLSNSEPYVWPDKNGPVRGQSIQPLYPSVVDAAREDPRLYELLALTDALRVGRAREKQMAIKLLRERIC